MTSKRVSISAQYLFPDMPVGGSTLVEWDPFREKTTMPKKNMTSAEVDAWREQVEARLKKIEEGKVDKAVIIEAEIHTPEYSSVRVDDEAQGESQAEA